MLIKKVKYVDYNGNNQEDTLYFNMTKAEVAAMQVRMDGKYIDYLQDLVAQRRIERLFNFFHNLVLDAYGEKSADGKRFVKTPDMRKAFEDSIAFSEVLTELMTDKGDVAAFVRAILPPDFQNIPAEQGMIQNAAASEAP